MVRNGISDICGKPKKLIGLGKTKAYANQGEITMGRTRGKRLGAVTRDEERWLDCLERSEIDTKKPFTATQAARMIAVTPNKNGTILKNIPLPRKLSHVLRKSPRYEALLKTDINSTTYWVIKSRDNYD
tara:strand:+ start:1373 stop:1759 length:387 start_codon:yes stop_codon:yes gene_type:complete